MSGSTPLADLSTSRHKSLPAGTQAFGMGLFLATLTMLFLGGLLVYLVLRLRTGTDPHGLPLHAIRVPQTLLFSTPTMVAASYFFHRALGAIRRGDGRVFKAALWTGAILSLLFVLLQAPALASLWKQHHAARAQLGAVNNGEAASPTPASHAFYGSILFLIATHAAHVVGGVVPLVVVLTKATRDRYTPASHGAVRMLTWYWHFLDVVWLVMFATFAVLG